MGTVAAVNWDWTVETETIREHFWGDIEAGTVQYGLDNTEADQWYGVEITKISKVVEWDGEGIVSDEVHYRCPGVAGEAKFGNATAYHSIWSNTHAKFNVNYKSNYAQLTMAAGNYPNGWFDWASYGDELYAEGDYELNTALYDKTGGTQNSWFDYYMAGSGTGRIKYGNARFSAGPNWGDGHGSVMLSSVEYNWAEATGSGFWGEDLGGEDYLKNAKFELPGGGHIHTEVWFNDGMNPTSVWMEGR